MKRIHHLTPVSVLMSALLLLGCLSASAADSALPTGSVPEDTFFSFSKTVNAGEAFTFNADSFDIAKSEKVTAVSITELPDAQIGRLLYEGREVILFEKIKRSDFNKLTFKPSEDAKDCDTAIGLRTQLSKNDPAVKTIYGITVLGEYNYPPTAGDIKIATQKNMTVTGWFDAKDIEGEALSYTIVTAPKKGEVTLRDDLAGCFDYTPYAKKTGSDKFTFQVCDPAGNVSEVATVSIDIKKPESKTFYQDLDGNGAHYAAIKLAEMDVLVGQTIGGKMLFHPEETVSKGAFLVMLMQTANLADRLPMSVVTGFSDDASIPVWMKSYVTEAVNTGLVRGTPESDGSLCFNPDKPITRAEAAVMTSAVLATPAADMTSAVFGYMEAIPAWSVSSFAGLEELGIMPCFSDGSVRAGDRMTRIEAAQLLWNLENYQSSSGPDRSFLSRLLMRD